jgi:hypothetical protein
MRLQAVVRVKPGATPGQKLYAWGMVAYQTGPDSSATRTSDDVIIRLALTLNRLYYFILPPRLDIIQ